MPNEEVRTLRSSGEDLDPSGVNPFGDIWRYLKISGDGTLIFAMAVMLSNARIPNPTITQLAFLLTIRLALGGFIQ